MEPVAHRDGINRWHLVDLVGVAGRRLSASSGDNGVEPLLRCRGVEKDFVRERHVEGSLELVTQLDESEAVNAEIVGELALHRERMIPVQLKLVEQRSDVTKYESLVLGRVRFIGHSGVTLSQVTDEASMAT